MTKKTLVGYLLKHKGKERIVVGTERINVGMTSFKMKNGCFLEVKDWNKQENIEDWIKSSYEKEKDENNIIDYAYFSKESVMSPEPYKIIL